MYIISKNIRRLITISSAILRAILVLVFALLNSCQDNSLTDPVSPAKLSLTRILERKENVFDVYGSLGLRESIVTFISLSCEHCHYQTQALLEDHVNRPSDLSLLFFATDSPDSLRSFSERFVYDTTTTIFAWDEAGQLAQQMGVTSYPTMFLYDTAGVHLQTIVGEAKPGYVYKFFHDAE